MKHRVLIIREHLEQIYQELDSFSMFRIVLHQLERLNRECYNNFIRFNRATPFERVSFTELKMVEEFRIRHKFSNLFQKFKVDRIVPDDLPETRALVGPERTNLDFSEVSETEQPIFNYNNDDGKHSAIHATIEHNEKNSGMRFARTFFLSTLVADEKYMDGVWFSEDADHKIPSDQGLLNQRNSLTLFNCYSALVKAFTLVSEQYLRGEISQNDLIGFATFQAFDQQISQ